MEASTSASISRSDAAVLLWGEVLVDSRFLVSFLVRLIVRA